MIREGVGIIIQARMGSSRLPGKVLKDFCGKTLLGRILERIGYLAEDMCIVVATSDLHQDDVIKEWCDENSIKCYRGDEKNVLCRYYECAKEFDLKHIVRMTGDNPFPDEEELERLIDYHLKNSMDFSENFSELPIGVGMEIFTFNALEDSVKYASLPKHFEHADEYILDNLKIYKHGVCRVDREKNFPDIRLTVDTDADYNKACYIFNKLQNKELNTVNIINICRYYEKEDI